MTSTKRIKTVKIITDGQVIRSYDFNYNYGYKTSDHPNLLTTGATEGKAIHSLLTSVTPWAGMPDPNADYKRLPATSFSYGVCNGFTGGCPLTSYTNGTSSITQTPNDFFLKGVDNNLNGKVTFEFYSTPLNVKYCDTDKLDSNSNFCKTDNKYNTQVHRLAATATEDGMGNNYRSSLSYTTDTPLAYVTNYGETWEEGLGCGEKPFYTTPPGSGCEESLYAVCYDPCDYQRAGEYDLSCCGQGFEAYQCSGDGSGCSNSYGNLLCQPVCDYFSTAFSGYQFLGYPEAETIVYEKNS